MLIGLDPLLSGDLLRALRRMGHGDTLCIADSNFPAASIAKDADLVEVAADASTVGRAVLSVLPLDGFVEAPVAYMAPIGRLDATTPAHDDFAGVIEAVAGTGWAMRPFERFAFYAEAARCRLMIATLERRPYANFILKKGVVGPNGAVARAAP